MSSYPPDEWGVPCIKNNIGKKCPEEIPYCGIEQYCTTNNIGNGYKAYDYVAPSCHNNVWCQADKPYCNNNKKCQSRSMTETEQWYSYYNHASITQLRQNQQATADKAVADKAATDKAAADKAAANKAAADKAAADKAAADKAAADKAAADKAAADKAAANKAAADKAAADKAAADKNAASAQPTCYIYQSNSWVNCPLNKPYCANSGYCNSYQDGTANSKYNHSSYVPAPVLVVPVTTQTQTPALVVPLEAQKQTLYAYESRTAYKKPPYYYDNRTFKSDDRINFNGNPQLNNFNPKGLYKNSCSCYLSSDGKHIHCYCKQDNQGNNPGNRFNDPPIFEKKEINTCADTKIYNLKNNNGYLQSHTSPSYLDGAKPCKTCSLSGNSYTCSCQQRNGNWRNTSINVANIPGTVCNNCMVNYEGTLGCVQNR